MNSGTTTPEAAVVAVRASRRPNDVLIALDTVALHTIVLPRPSRGWAVAKRASDLFFALVALGVLAPLLLVIAIAVKLGSPGPIFFRQVRMGAANRPFRVFKFRTMSTDADSRKTDLAHLNRHAQNGGSGVMFKLENDPRVTPLGRFLRRYFLDELPQLINVVFGEMSLVGPRPLVLDEDRHVLDWARHRLDMRPGMTGLWQVLGHSVIPFEQMIKLDYLYVSTWSFGNDWRLVLRTIPLVLRGDGDRV